MRGRYFRIFQPKYMLNLCLNLNESQLIYVYAYERYAYKKKEYLHSSQTQTILVNYFSLLYR